MGSEDDGARLDPADAVLAAMRRSIDLVQDLLYTAAVQAERIRSLDAELTNARQRIAFLEGETSQLRQRLSDGVQGVDPAQFEDQIEEQNAFAHLFVTSDRLSRVRTPDEVIRVADEVVQNLVGADRYGIWLRWEGELRLVGPTDPRWRSEPGLYRDLLSQALAHARPARTTVGLAGAVPIAVPILLDGSAVGALLVAGLVPQVGRLGRLQDDLLNLLSDRIGPSLCLTALRSGGSVAAGAWAGVRAMVPGIEEARP